MKVNVRIHMISESDRCDLWVDLIAVVPRRDGAMMLNLKAEFGT